MTRFTADFHHRVGSSDVVTRLMQDWHAISKDELERLFNKLPNLSPADREQIERSVGRIVNKLLHPPLTVLKDEARDGTPHGLINALRRLFRIEG
jgi:glutamyl-tRNA reductase